MWCGISFASWRRTYIKIFRLCVCLCTQWARNAAVLRFCRYHATCILYLYLNLPHVGGPTVSVRGCAGAGSPNQAGRRASRRGGPVNRPGGPLPKFRGELRVQSVTYYRVIRCGFARAHGLLFLLPHMSCVAYMYGTHAGSRVCVGSARAHAQCDRAVVIVVINSVMLIAMKALGRFERHASVSDEQASTAFKVRTHAHSVSGSAAVDFVWKRGEGVQFLALLARVLMSGSVLYRVRICICEHAVLFVFAQVFLAQFLNTGVMFLIVNANANFPALRAIGLLNGQFHEARAVATSINFIFVFCISISISIAMLSAASCVNFRWIHWVCDKSYMTR